MIDHLALESLVKKAANAACVNFPSHYDASDVEQTLWLWVFEKKNTVEDIIRNTERPEGTLYNLMTKEANSYLKKEDAVSHGYSEEDAFNYPLALVKLLLEDAFDYNDWQSFALKGDGQPSSKVQANMTGDRLAMLADIKSAVNKLPDDQYNLIIWAYKYHYSKEALGLELGIGPKAAQQRLSRAVGAVQRILGTKPLADVRKGYSGDMAESVTRGRMGSVEAQHVTERYYEG